MPTPETWPSEPANAPWIRFWHDLEAAIGGRLGDAGLADGFWGAFDAFPPDAGMMLSRRLLNRLVQPTRLAPRGEPRPVGGRGDIGAIER